MFGVETRAWSVTTPAAPSLVTSLLETLPEPGRREWLTPGVLAPLVRARRDGTALYLRLSPGDPRRGPGSADRAYVTVAPAGQGSTVEVRQRPVRWLQVGLGALVVAAWSGAAVAAAYGLTHSSLDGLAGVPIVLGLRGVTEAGRRLDERRLRGWLDARLGRGVDRVVVAARPARAYGPARYDVPAADCR